MKIFRAYISTFLCFNKSVVTLLFSTIISTNAILQAQHGENFCAGCINYNCIEQLHENVYLHLSRWSVVAGERLDFKAYMVKNKNIDSKILYIEIFDSKNNLKVFSRANIDSGICMSSIAIPDSLSTGLYHILAYTNLMRNFPVSSFMRSSLLIIGMNNKTINSGTDSISKNASSSDQQNDIHLTGEDPSEYITATLNKHDYGINEKVILNIDVNKNASIPIEGSYSVSVFEKIPGKYSNLNSPISIIDSISSNNPNDFRYKEWLKKNKDKPLLFQYKTENKTFLLNGILLDKTSGKLEKRKIVYLSTPDSLANLKYSITDTSGQFIFALDKRYDNRKILLNASDDDDSKEYSYIIDNKQIKDSLLAGETLSADSLMNDFIMRSKKIASINKIYFKGEDLKINFKKLNSYSHFYSKPDFSLRLSDYSELENFSEITDNLIPNIVFKKRKDKYSMRVGNVVFSKFPDRNCLVLFNNVPLHNYEYLSKLGSGQIELIEVIYKNLIYGEIDFAGVVSIFTKDRTAFFNKQTLNIENKVEGISNFEKKRVNVTPLKFPDFQQVLLWNPDLKLDENGHTSVEFNSSSLPTEYFIDIEGLTRNGIPVSKRITFKVQ